MAQVFISYSRKDLPFVEKLVSDLKAMGLDVWYDLSGLEGGARWGVEIRNAIQSSDFVIVVLSPDSVESVWVEREYLYSDSQKKKLLPIMYRECELPLGFMNVNYVDVQGENYSHNFEKITRFLNSSSAPAAVAKARPAAAPAFSRRIPATAVIVTSVAALAALGFYLWFNGRELNTVSLPDVTQTAVPTAIEPTASSVSAVSLVTETSIPIEPTATFIEQASPTSGAMITSAPIQVDVGSQAVFIHLAAGENMRAYWTDVKENTLASDPEARVFVMPNWSPAEVYNKHQIAIWYRGSQWAILNQDMESMPHKAAFNVQIVNPNESVFIQEATANNIEKSWTVIDNDDHPLASDPNAIVFAMPTWTLNGAPARDNNHPIGVWYTGSQWAIINLDGAAMREGAAFNIQILSPSMNAFVHTATSSNTSANWTVIDNNRLARDANKLLFVMPRGLPDGTEVNNARPIGVWHDGTQWTIFNQLEDDQITPTEADAMPEDTEFNVLILDRK